MPVLVHLTPEPQARRILRSGIRAARLQAHPAGRGIFCSPMLPSYFVSHQWLRELKRGGQRTIVAIDFRVRDDEPVWVGHYGQPHVETTAGEAVGVIMRREDPRGYEVIVPRSVQARELLRTRAVPQVTGWRYYPDAKGKAPCTCDYCNKGRIKGGRLWRPANPPQPKRSRAEIIAQLEVSNDEWETCDLLSALGRKWRRDADDLAFLAEHESPRVLEVLAETLGSFRGAAARGLLLGLCGSRTPEVRRAAVASLARGMPWPAVRELLAPFARDSVIAGELRRLGAD